MKSNLAAILVTAALASAGTTLAGCDDGPKSTVALAQFPAAYAQALCVQNFKCCSASDLGAHTMQQCTDDASTGLTLLSSLISDGQTNSRVSYDADRMGMCITAVSQLSCDDWKKGLTLWSNQPDACKAAIAPKVAAGGSCQQDIECITAHCDGADSSIAPPADGKCTSLVGSGVSCAGGLSCADGFYCESIGQKCAALKPAGQSCTADEECMNTCNLTTGVCSAYAGCALGDSAPRPARLSLALVAIALVLGRRGRGRSRRSP